MSLLLLLDNAETTEETVSEFDATNVTTSVNILAELFPFDSVDADDAPTQLTPQLNVSDVIAAFGQHLQRLVALRTSSSVTSRDPYLHLGFPLPTDVVGATESLRLHPELRTTDLVDVGAVTAQVIGVPVEIADLLDVTDAYTLHPSIFVSSSVTSRDPYLHLGFPLPADSIGVVDLPPRLHPRIFTSDSVTVGDATSQVIGVPVEITDLIDTADVHSLHAEIFVADATTLSDLAQGLRGFLVVASDTIAVADGPVDLLVKLLEQDAITATEAYSRSVYSVLRDGVVVGDEKAPVNIGVPLSDSVTVIDRMARSIARTLQDGIDAIDNVIPMYGKQVEDLVSAQDDIRRAVGVIQKSVVTVGDQRGLSVGLDLSDSALAASVVTRLVGLSIADSLDSTERVLKAVGLVTADTTTIGDDVTHPISVPPLTALTNIADIIRIAVALVVSSQINTTDSTTRIAGGIVHEDVLDTVLLADRVLLHVRALLRSSLGLSDIHIVGPGIHPTDTTSVSDSRVLHPGLFASDDMSAATATLLGAKLRTSDDIDLTDYTLAIPQYQVALLDTVLGTDLTTRAVSLLAVSSTYVIDLALRSVSARFSDVVASPDAFLLRPGLRISDGIDVSWYTDQQLGVQEFLIQIADAIGVADPAARLSLSALLWDQADITTQPFTVKTFLETLFDNIGVTDAAVRARLESAVLIDSVTAQDKVQQAVDLLIADALQVLDFPFTSVSISVLIKTLTFTGEVLRASGFQDEALRITKLVDDVLRPIGMSDERLKH